MPFVPRVALLSYIPPVTARSPVTESLANGEVVPTPTLPEERMVSFAVLLGPIWTEFGIAFVIFEPNADAPSPVTVFWKPNADALNSP